VLIELIGRINERGQLEIELPADLAPGQVRLVIEAYEPGAEADDEARWDALFAQSQDLLETMARAARAEYQAGLTIDFDPELDARR
jgi:hypothetical protein